MQQDKQFASKTQLLSRIKQKESGYGLLNLILVFKIQFQNFRLFQALFVEFLIGIITNTVFYLIYIENKLD